MLEQQYAQMGGSPDFTPQLVQSLAAPAIRLWRISPMGYSVGEQAAGGDCPSSRGTLDDLAHSKTCGAICRSAA